MECVHEATDSVRVAHPTELGFPVLFRGLFACARHFGITSSVDTEELGS